MTKISIVAVLLLSAGCGVSRNFSLGSGTEAGTETRPPMKSSPTPTPLPSPPDDQEPAPLAAPTVVLAKGIFQSADACQTTGRRLEIAVPNPDRLDPRLPGPVAGIEFREVTKVNQGGYRGVKLSGGTLSFEIYAQGKGLAVEVLGSTSCKGGEGSAVGYDLIAHYL